MTPPLPRQATAAMAIKEKGSGVKNLTLSNVNDFIGRELGVSSWMTEASVRVA
jgi:hypothetical protein